MEESCLPVAEIHWLAKLPTWEGVRRWSKAGESDGDAPDVFGHSPPFLTESDAAPFSSEALAEAVSSGCVFCHSHPDRVLAAAIDDELQLHRPSGWLAAVA